MTENLDEKYKNLLNKVRGSFRPVGATKDEVYEKDDYDKLVGIHFHKILSVILANSIKN